MNPGNGLLGNQFLAEHGCQDEVICPLRQGQNPVDDGHDLAYSSGMVATRDTLGIGVYTPAEAALYARVPPRMMSRWVFGTSDRKAVIDRQLQESNDKVITFLDFIQTLAVREVRQRHGLSLQRIRQGIETARDDYGLEYPLACRHKIFLFSDKSRQGHGEMVVRLEGFEGSEGDTYVQITGRAKGNMMLTPVVEMFLDDLTFDPITKLATQYRPMSEGRASILLDPHRRFGEPIVEPNGYTAASLWHATNTEGSLEAAAEAYGVTRDEVLLANKYFDSLSPEWRA